MKTMTKFASSLILLLLASPVLLLSGCGTDVVKSQGCPSGSYLANATDTITGPADTTFDAGSSVGAVFAGGSFLLTPLTFTVTDNLGDPRNNICLTLYTGDTAAGPGPFWYTDLTYGTFFTGTGPYNFRTVATNDSGVAILYWSTAVLPAGLPRTLASAGSPPTYTAGADQTGTSYIKVYSGAKSAIFNVNWTVKGEPAS
jgi:hypothetical protein